jgi:hypothetical protein
VGFGAQVLQYGSPSLDPASLSGNLGQLFDRGLFGASEVVGILGYGRTLLGFRVGVNAKAGEQRLRDASAGAMAFDVGIAKDVGVFTLGLGGQHLGPDVSLHGFTRPLPTRLTVSGAFRRRPLGPLDVGGAAAVSRLQDGKIVPAAGIEVSYWPISGRTFTGRLGYRRVPTGDGRAITWGLAFTADAFTIEYAMESFGSTGTAHRVGVVW